jgi:phosphopantetheine--protein transferase-like protein
VLVEEKLITDSIILGLWKIEEALPYFENNKSLDTAHLGTIKSENKKLEYAASRYLASYLCKDFENSLIIKDEKIPIFKYLPFSISISHSFPFIAVIIGKKKEKLGVDIELFSDRILKIGNRFMNENEWNAMPAEAIKSNYLMQIWSAKEATFKYFKNGSLEFSNNIEVHLENKMVIIKKENEIEKIQLISHSNSEYVLSICLK